MAETPEQFTQRVEGQITEQKTAILGELQKQKAEFEKGITDLNAAMKQEIEQIRKNGAADPETKEKIDRIEKHVNQLEGMITRAGGGGREAEVKTVGESLTSDERFVKWHKGDFVAEKAMRFPVEGGSFIANEKAILTDSGVGAGTSGVLMPRRRPGIVALLQRELRIRDLLTVIPFRGPGNSVDYVKENVFTNRASPQAGEGVSKPESELTFTTDSARVVTIGHHINVSRQALDDIAGLRERIDINMMYGLKLIEEYEIVSGSGTGEHLKGITTQATAYATSTYNKTGDTKLDILRHAILQARLALYPVDGVVLNPRDLHDIDLIKEEAGGANKGSYVVGDPRTGAQQRMIWGKSVVESDSIAPGQFLVGAFALGAELYDKMSATIEISFEHADNFIKNLATILAEERLALAVIRPAAFVTGMFPA